LEKYMAIKKGTCEDFVNMRLHVARDRNFGYNDRSRAQVQELELLKIQLLGHFQAQRDGLNLPGLRLNGANRLLALMALQAGRPVRSAWVAEALWPETSSLDSLRKASQQLRQALGPDAGRLRSENGFLRLALSEIDIDLVAFDTCLGQGDYRSYAIAIDIYIGPLLQSWEDAWVLPKREARDKQYRAAILKLLEMVTKEGFTRQEQFALATQILSKGIAIYPTCADWWAQLITIQAKSGARLEGLATGQRYLEYVQQANRAEGLNIPPSPIILKLMQQLQVEPGPISAEQTPDLTAYEAVGGASPLDSRFYVERPEDLVTHHAIGQCDSIVLIKGARQTGKSSLLARALHRARQNGATVLRTEWQKLRPEDLATPAAFYRAQAQSLSTQLRLKIDLADAFRDESAPSNDFEWFMRDHIFTAVEIDTPILWAIDDADRLFSCPFRDDVFALFRSWHNERAFDAAGPWHQFTMVLAYATEAHLAIRNLHQSPFNVGTRVALGDFTPTQLCTLNARYSNPLDDSEVDRLYDLVGGHPYLVRRALHEVAIRHTRLDDIVARAVLDGGIFADHLNRLLETLRADADLCADLRRILGGDCRSEDSSARLCAAGLLVRDASGELRARCRLYDLFLRRRLL
jgi:DNA-binding SARP family transcriptional activator